MDLKNISIKSLNNKFENNEFSVTEFIEEHFKFIKKGDINFNSFIQFFIDDSLNQAKIIDSTKSYNRNILAGIPYSVKDNIFIKNKNITMGSILYKDFLPDYDADIVNLINNNDSINIGVNNMHELGWGFTTNNLLYGQTKNPYDVNKSPGGSSGGSATAVALGYSMFSIGTDSGGSVRVPASVTGVTSLKPTYNKLSLRGVFPLTKSLDNLGIITKSSKDLEFIYSKLFRDINLHTEAYEIVVGVEYNYFLSDIDPLVKNRYLQIIDLIKREGVKVVEINVPNLEKVNRAQLDIFFTESTFLQKENISNKLEEYSPDVRERLLEGEKVKAIDYLEAKELQKELYSDFQEIFRGGVDVLITPTTPYSACDIKDNKVIVDGKRIEYSKFVSKYTRPFNFTGLPALNVPAGKINKMPIGMQLISSSNREDLVLSFGKFLDSMEINDLI